MNQQDSEDKLDPLDPHRRELQPPIPTHPPDPLARGEVDKVVPPKKPEWDPNDPERVNTGLGSGRPIDPVGGPRLGEPPGDAGTEKPATIRDRDTRADDLQDRTGKT
jgi:hypothetical protein